MVCDIRYMLPVYVEPEDSRSMSPIIRIISKKSKLSDPKILSTYILKLSYPITPYGATIDNSMMVERDIYRDHVNRLITDMNTPNVAAFYYSVVVKSRFYRSLPNPCKPLYWNFCREMVEHQLDIDRHNDIYDFHNLHILAIEDLKGSDMTDWIPNSRYNNLKSVIFQVIYTLQCMSEVGIRHNDLHDKNIFVVNYKNPEFILYVIDYDPDSGNHEAFLIPTKHNLAKVYDFDNGCVSKTDHNEHELRNTRLDIDTDRYGMANRANPKFDSFTFIGYMLYEIVMQATDYKDDLEIDSGMLSLPFEVLREVIEKLSRDTVDLMCNSCVIFKDIIYAAKVYRMVQHFVLDWNLMEARWRLPFRMGKVKVAGFYDPERQSEKEPDLVPRDDEFLSNMDILRTKYFSRWKVNDLSSLKDVDPNMIYLLPSISKYRDDIIRKIGGPACGK